MSRKKTKRNDIPYRVRRVIAFNTRRELVKRFPDCFIEKGLPKIPLKVGIFDDLMAVASDIPEAWLRIALCDYTYGPTYLRALLFGASRIDLAGRVVSSVSAIAEEGAIEKMKQYPWLKLAA